MSDTVAPASPATPGKSRLPLVAAVVGAVVVVGGGAFAVQKVVGGGTQPHDVLPASVIAYARIDGDPSASQKVSLFRLIRKAPEVAKEIGIKNDKQDIRKSLVQSLLEDCEVDYDKEIAPWLGDRFGFGLAKSGDTGYFAIQVTDEKESRKGIELIGSCVGIEDPGIVYTQGYAILGETQKATVAAAKEAETSSLADKAAFAEDMDSLGDQGIVSAWADAKGLSKAFATEMGAEAAASFKTIRSGAAALRAGDDNIELASVGHSVKDTPKFATVDLGRLPVDSVLAASLSGGGEQVGAQWDTFMAGFAEGFAMSTAPGASPESTPDVGPDEVDSLVKEFEDFTGFALPEDLETLFGDNITFVAGDRNLSKIADFEGPEDVKTLDIALALQSDQAKAFALAEKITALVSRYTGIELAVVKTSKGAVIATNKKFGTGFTEGEGLRDNGTFTRVIPDADEVFGGFYVDIAKAVAVAREMDAPEKDLAQLKELNGLGLSVTRDDERTARGTVRLSFR